MLLCYSGGRAVQTKSASLVAGARAAFSSVTLVSTPKWHWLAPLSFIGSAFVRDVVHLKNSSRKVVMRRRAQNLHRCCSSAD
jgi:hypothetical protein